MSKIGRLFSFSGRTGRLHYWQISLALQLVITIPFCLFLFLAITFRIGPLAGIGLIPIVLALPAALALTLRRLHDRNRSAWWWLVFFGPLLAAGVMATSASAVGGAPSLTLVLVVLVSQIMWLWGWIELGFLRGTRGPNRYGSDPYAAGS